MAAIGGGNDSDDAPSTNNNANTANSNVETHNGTSGTEEVSSAGALGDYYVEIKDAFLTQDYEHKPVIVIIYSWTNNSDETTANWTSVIEKAFQDGIELESAIMVDDERYDSGSSMNDVRPGTTIDIQVAYVMTSETSKVEFEISELISFSDDIVYKEFDPSSL